MKIIISALFVICFICCGKIVQSQREQISDNPPNIVLIYLDDLGYGDVSAYGSKTISTPHMDYLANNGIKFLNGYATSATCTPSRYGLLTGRYPWREKNVSILPGDAPLLIDTASITLPKMLQQQGYVTGIVGKWHLGLGNGNINWNEEIHLNTNDVGFDYSYIMAATQDRVPTVYIENRHVLHLDPEDPIFVDYEENFEGEPTALSHPELQKMKWHHGHNNSIVNGIPRIGFMKGGQSARWVDENMADTFLVRAQQFIKQQDGQKFFLYYAMQQPHVPRTPHPRFVGSSGMGPRGDVILEADWCIGELIKTLEMEGLLDNTLIILTSDNGPVINNGYYDMAYELLGDHDPSGGLRGGKGSLYEAGTRVPFITYWKNQIKPQTSMALVSQVDFLSSLAALTNSEIRGDDSQNVMEALLGKSKTGRESLMIEASRRTALRQGDYVMIPPHAGPLVNKNSQIETGYSPDYALYNLSDDPGQQNNLAKSEPEKLSELIREYERLYGIEKD